MFPQSEEEISLSFFAEEQKGVRTGIYRKRWNWQNLLESKAG